MLVSSSAPTFSLEKNRPSARSHILDPDSPSAPHLDPSSSGPSGISSESEVGATLPLGPPAYRPAAPFARPAVRPNPAAAQPSHPVRPNSSLGPTRISAQFGLIQFGPIQPGSQPNSVQQRVRPSLAQLGPFRPNPSAAQFVQTSFIYRFAPVLFKQEFSN
ncbi:hypothetical protein CRG98_010160 [Punica granatum]|uniref:Uncharacterized protein n=1 Tax=Punica granatum TaxID=22663 RepID=A0A2I0KLS7_PUNGR|nr:hypothetical protein CRG98_010160 [Punica granatum]